MPKEHLAEKQRQAGREADEVPRGGKKQQQDAFHAVGAGAIAIVLGFSLVVLLIFNYPYSGSLAVDSKAYQSGVLAQYFLSLDG